MADKIQLTTPAFIASFPNLFKARKNDLSDKLEYSVMALFAPNTDISSITDAVSQAMADQFGENIKKWPKGWRNPIRNIEERRNEDGELPAGCVEGMKFMNLKSQYAPGIVDANLEEVIDPEEIYPGVILKASITAYAYDMKANKGVAFGLNAIQKVRDGERLAGKPDPKKLFKQVDSEEADPFAGDTEEEAF